MKAKLLALLICSILFIGFPNQGQAASDDKVLDHQKNSIELADRVFQYTEANQLAAASSLLNELAQHWKRDSRQFSDQNREVITASIIKLKILLNKSGNTQGERVDAAVSLRLAFDALDPNGQHLWKTMQPEVLNSLSHVEKALKKEDLAQFQYQLNHFLDKYSVIYPALVIDKQSDVVQLVDKQIAAFSGNRLQDVHSRTRIRQLNDIERELKLVFSQNANNGALSDIGLSASLGAIIVTVLSYASLRRFVGERARRQRIH
ncbi:sporulation protein YpjB [Sporolactobacillus sp. CPB3-1]|uniref:Sporulation protein YpjB n=1 Tax=Sporolactobacillus mangiferae TaxID=2940498 RepID=A0ABT0MAC4_9BACL|nr:sporulation protein YpjB [Sporolactobacillus mangiferae]MCL1631826.1 sporulation protein YpjB [Sporolactobacillus mangiferae]